MRIVPVCLSCGCIWDPNEDGKPHGCDESPNAPLTDHNVFVQGKCLELATAMVLNKTPEAIEAWSKNFDRHVSEIEEYRKRNP